MKVSIALTIFITVLSATSTQRAAAQQVSLLDPINFDLRGTVAKDTITVPLKIEAPLSIKDIALLSDTPYLVSLGNKYNQRYKDAIRVYMNDRAPLLNIAVDMQLLNTQGSYEVSVLYTLKKKGPHLLKLTLIRPPATIDTVATVYINITGKKVSPDPLVLNALRSLSDVHALQLSSPFFTGINEPDLISFPEKSYSVRAGTYFTANLKLADGFASKLEVGITRGKLQVMSPEMTAPVVVHFEISKKRDKSLIIVFVFAGLFIGVLVRHVLKDKKEWEETRIKGLEVMSRIVMETKLIADEPFRNDVANLLNELSSVLNSRPLVPVLTGRTDKPLVEKIELTVKNYNARKDKFQDQLKTALGELKDLSGSFEDPALGGSTKAFFEPATIPYRDAKKFLEKLNPTEAETAIARTKAAINKLLAELSTYYKSFADLMDKDTSYPTEVTAEEKTFLRKYVAEIQSKLLLVKVNAAPAKEITSSVLAADAAIEAGEKMIEYLKQIITAYYGYPPELNSHEEAKKFALAMEEWNKALRNMTSNPLHYQNASQYMAPDLITRFDAAWTAFKAKFGGHMADDGTPEVKATLPEVKFGPKPNYTPADYFVSGTAMISLSADIVKARRHWIWAAVIQTAVLSVLLGLAAFLYYGSTFTGTWNELIGIFLVSFSIDITVDNVVQLRDKK